MKNTFLIIALLIMSIATARAQDVDAVYNAKDGFVVVEAEHLEYSENWILKNERNNHTGDGYLIWSGEEQGVGHEEDEEGQYQGDPADWLTIPVYIPTPGRYRVDIRNTHEKKDGDNDIWVHIKEFDPPVRRMGDHGVQTFQWLTWGPSYVYWDIAEPGIYTFYLAGRSVGFGVDRIVVHNEYAPVHIKNKYYEVHDKVDVETVVD